MKSYIVTVEINDVITNRLVKAENAEEAEKEALECASREILESQVPD